MELCHARVDASPAVAPDGLELRHLRAFVVTAELLHFGRAAHQLHLSQPALSRQIAAPERLVGRPLLHRSTHHVEVTPAGSVLLEHARQVVDDVERAVTATRSTGGAHTDRTARWQEPLATALESGVDLDELRSIHEGLLTGLPLPHDITVRPTRIDGVPGLVLAPEAARTTLTVLHLHGGGYVMGSAYGYRSLAGAIAMAISAEVTVPDYRLAPEHPYPAALHDALTVYQSLTAATDPSSVVLVGDSAGAGLVMTLLLTAHRLDLPLPRCAVLLSPWIDPAPHGGHPNDTRRWVRDFAAQHTHVVDLDTAVNPLTADLTGLPPTLIHVGDGDPTIGQTRTLASRMRRHGQYVDFHTFPVSTHVFHHFWDFLPDADRALDQIGRFVLDGDGSPGTAASRSRPGGSCD